MLTHAVGLICLLGATVLATTITRSWLDRVGLLAGLLVGVWLVQPEPLLVGSLATVVITSQLARPRWTVVGMIGAGLLSGGWANWLYAGGWPWGLALVAGGAAPAVAARLTLTRSGFATVRTREEAFCTVGALSLLVTMTPVVSTGWRSAVALNLPARTTGPGADGPWPVPVMLGMLFLGGVHSLWRRQ